MKKMILLALGLITISAYGQVTVNINPDKDNSIYSDFVNNSNGQGPLFSGTTCSGNVRRALLHFDIAGNLPAGAVVTSVTLTLNVNNNGGSSGTEAYTLRPLTANWGEGISSSSLGTGAPAVAPDATWAQSVFGSTAWATPGGDYGPISAVTNLTEDLGDFTWSSAGMVTDVQNWLNTPANNHGWVLIGDELTDCTARRFGSGETGVAPVLAVTYNCSSAPTAICQNLTAALDANGDYVLNPADLDGGSVAVCGGTLGFSATQTLFDCADAAGPPIGNLVITSVFDGPLTGGVPKGIELYVLNDIADLSLYGLGLAANGSTTDGEEFSFPAVAVTAGTYIYVGSEAVEFQNFFGFAPDYTTIHVNINGDDVIELFENGSVIDAFGQVGVDGTGQPWEYTDGWAYRNNNSGPDGNAFTLGNWYFSGINALDPATSNSTAAVPVPVGTFTSGGQVAVTVTVTDQFSNTATCDAVITVIDIVAPSAQCIAPTTFNLDMAGNLTLTAVDIDNGTTDACGLTSLMISQTSFSCLDLGPNAITLTATDIYGNVSTCLAGITIAQVGGITIAVDNALNVTCNGDADGEIQTTIAGGTPPYTLDWDNDGTGDNDDTDDITGLSGGVYTLTVVDDDGCTAEEIVTITEPSVISATLIPTDISCFGETDGAIAMTVTGGTGPYVFDWDNDGTGDNDDTEDLSGLDADVYEVLITDDNGCEAIFNATILDATPVDVSVTQTGFTLTANATGSTFLWVDCPSYALVPFQSNAVFNPTADGEYAVVVTDGNGCEDTSACYTIFGMGMGENVQSLLQLYPNPVNSFLTITTPAFSEAFIITISDANGRLVQATTVLAPNQVIDVSALENGIYFITPVNGTNSVPAKFVISR